MRSKNIFDKWMISAPCETILLGDHHPDQLWLPFDTTFLFTMEIPTKPKKPKRLPHNWCKIIHSRLLDRHRKMYIYDESEQFVLPFREKRNIPPSDIRKLKECGWPVFTRTLDGNLLTLRSSLPELEIKSWCHETCEGRYGIIRKNNVVFERQSDYALALLSGFTIHDDDRQIFL